MRGTQQDYPREDESLADPLPPDPAPILRRWFDEAIDGRVQLNPTAMTLATVDPDGRPSARMVICRGFDLERGLFVFYTDRESKKSEALAAYPMAALIFHWDALGRQVRIEGRVTLSPDAESDAYFAGRPREAQLAAWASDQSRPIASRAALLARYEAMRRRFGPDEGAQVPRPPNWGGYRVWAERIELWVGRPGRLHDRALWSRQLRTVVDGCEGTPWQVRRLQP